MHDPKAITAAIARRLITQPIPHSVQGADPIPVPEIRQRAGTSIAEN